MGILHSMTKRARLGEVGSFSPVAQRMFDGGLLGRLCRFFFRPTMEGWENLPDEGPFLLVVNHSGGGAVDVLVLATLRARELERSRKLAAMAHPVVFHFPVVAYLLREFGAIPSGYEPALGALQAGIPVLVFPGGDHEAFRPIWQASLVDFNRREGFLRLAREANVPIVPLGIRGSHYTVPILWRSKILPWLLVYPRLLGVKRLPLTAAALLGSGLLLGVGGPAWGFPMAGLMAALWFASPTNIFIGQVPWKVSARIGAPIPAAALFGDDGERPLQEAHDDVVAAVQELVRS
jgi:1-acyl-sn-glycerol-3-phosphate acyltransferase